MCVFLDILRCLLCCEGEDDTRPPTRDIESLVVNRNRNFYREVPSHDTYFNPRTVAPAIYTPFTSQSNAGTPTTRLHSHNTSVTSTAHKPKVVLPPSSSIPVFQTSIISSVQKPKVVLPPSSSIPVFQTSVISSVQKPKVVLPSSSSSSSSSIPVFLTSETPFVQKPKVITSSSIPVFRTSVIPSLQKPKVLSPPSTPVFQKTTSNSDVKTSLDQKLSHNFSSTKPPPQTPSITKLPSPKPSPSTSSKPDSASGASTFATKPTLSQAPFNPTTTPGKTNYVWVEKGASPLYMIPKDIKDLIEVDIVPAVLKNPLSPATYKDYFAALLYAEDDYLERWDGFEMEEVTLELHKAAIYGWKSKDKHLNRSDGKDDKIFVAFKIDSVPERRPFLLSRDFASVRPSGSNIKPFQGIVYRVVKSDLVLIEFGEDFHSRHKPACKYDVKFSFNRVCLKRAHQAIASASAVVFSNFLFPKCSPETSLDLSESYFNYKLDRDQNSAVGQISNLRDPPPYLVEGLAWKTRVVVQEAVIKICRDSPLSRVLICSPTNNTCDVLMMSLQKEIPESDMFRANAAFRELDGVPFDILPSCLYKGECFSCPSLKKLKKYKVISSTFMSSFRLHGEGIVAGHFSHIFLVDASSVTEPEAMVPVVNLANERTALVVTGAPRNRSGWIRSNIARQNGLMISYFERLKKTNLYNSPNSRYITRLKD